MENKKKGVKKKNPSETDRTMVCFDPAPAPISVLAFSIKHKKTEEH